MCNSIMFRVFEAFGFLLPAMTFSFCSHVLNNVVLGEVALYAFLTMLGVQYMYKAYKMKIQNATTT